MMAQRKPTPEEHRRNKGESAREAVRRHALRKKGRLPPPTPEGIAQWWKERSR